MNSFKHFAAVAILVVSGLSLVGEAHALDLRIVPSLKTYDYADTINQNRAPIKTKECAKARLLPRLAGKLTAQCDRRQPGTYYSTETCRCEDFI